MPRLKPFILTISLLLAPAAVLAQDPLLHFERIHTRITGEANNRLSVKVFADGTAIATIPTYMKRSGRHAFALSAPQVSEIEVMVNALTQISQESLDQERAATLSGRSGKLAHDVSDPDTVTFTVMQDNRSRHSLVAPSPGLTRDPHRSDSHLGQLAEIEQQLRNFVQIATEGRP